MYTNIHKKLWNSYTFSDKDIILNHELIEELVNSFFEEVMVNYSNDDILGCYLRVNYEGGTVKSYSKLRYINKNSKDSITKIFNLYVTAYDGRYSQNEIESVSIDYRHFQDKKDTKLSIPFKETFTVINKLGLPTNMDIFTWTNRNIKISNDYKEAQFIKDDLGWFFEIYDTYYICNIEDLDSGDIILTFKDEFTPRFELDCFTRTMKDCSYTYLNGEIIYSENMIISNLISKTPIEKEYSNPFITYDTETRKLSDNSLEVISISMYNGIEYKSYYLQDYLDLGKTSQDMIYDSIDYISTFFNGYNVYIHNLSFFDGIFMLKSISDYKKEHRLTVDFIYKDSKMILISIKGKDVLFTFKDSYLILPKALEDLAKDFNTTKKGGYDHTKNDVTPLTNKVFKKELLEYNRLDCKVLYEIIVKFSKEIFTMFKLNLNNYPTLSSLAFGIFRSNFMFKKNISITSFDLWKDIKDGYTGGHVDVYKPYGKNLYYYDVNSLYPTAMLKYPYPVYNPTYFNGHRELKDCFGIVYAKITAPKDLQVPILLTKLNGRTVAPLGTWSNWYVTEELKNAIKYGYKVEISKGYLYEKEYIFDNYVKKLYANRIKYPKTDVRNLISKLLLNSLYGRFGMSPILDQFMIVDVESLTDNEYNKLFNTHNVSQVVNFNNDVHLLSSEIEFNKVLKSKQMNISLPISMFVTAYSRIIMSKYKMEYKDHLYYSDTDSLILDCELPEDVVNNSLGNFKLEHKINEGVFLAPKLYGFIPDKGKPVIKIKGSKTELKFEDLKLLLEKNNSIKLNQDKWFRHLDKGTIKILKTIYTCSVTENKRKLIYVDNKLTGTKPIVIDEA